MFKRTTALIPLMLLVCMLAACPNPSTNPAIVVRATISGSNTTICIKGSGFTSNGTYRVSMTMPPYTVNGQAGPNPLVNPPFGNGTALSSGGFQQTLNLGGNSAVCGVLSGQNAPSQPVLLVVDQTTFTGGAAALPPGFMCGSQATLSPPGPPTPIPPPPPFGDPSACQ